MLHFKVLSVYLQKVTQNRFCRMEISHSNTCRTGFSPFEINTRTPNHYTTNRDFVKYGRNAPLYSHSNNCNRRYTKAHQLLTRSLGRGGRELD